MIDRAHLAAIRKFHQELFGFCAEINGKLELGNGTTAQKAKIIQKYRKQTVGYRVRLRNLRARARGLRVQFLAPLGNLPRDVLNIIGAMVGQYDQRSHDLMNTIEGLLDARDLTAQLAEINNV